MIILNLNSKCETALANEASYIDHTDRWLAWISGFDPITLTESFSTAKLKTQFQQYSTENILKNMWGFFL